LEELETMERPVKIVLLIVPRKSQFVLLNHFVIFYKIIYGISKSPASHHKTNNL
jgi:hypothetical protein